MTRWNPGWIPKVGDRVMLTRNETLINSHYCGLVGTVTQIQGEPTGMHAYYVRLDREGQKVPSSYTNPESTTFDISMLEPWVDVPLDTIDDVEAYLNE